MNWDQVEAAARETVRAALADAMPIAQGDKVAWADCSYGKTDGLSEVHRVSAEVSADGEPLAYCGEVIPAETRRLAVFRSLDVCGVCENRHHQAATVAFRRSA